MILRYLFRFLFALLCLAVGGVTFLLVASPADMLRDKVVESVRDATGRELVISGGGSLRFFPSLAITFGDVALHDPPEMGLGALVRMERLELAVRLWPLLKRRLSVERLALVRPVIELRSDARGRRNWDLLRPATRQGGLERRRLRFAAANEARTDASPFVLAATDESEPAHPTAGLADLGLGDVRIIEGTLRYADERTGARRELTGIDAQLSLGDLSHPLTLDASLKVESERHNIVLQVLQPAALLGAGSSDLTLTLGGARIEGRLEGKLALLPAPRLEGKLDARSASAHRLAALLGISLPPAPGYGAFSFAGLLQADSAAITVRDGLFELDGSVVRGDLAIELARARPLIRGDLAFARLDLNRFMTAAPSSPPTGLTPQKAQASQPAPVQPGPAPQVRGWSNAPIDLPGLRAIDAQVALKVGELVLQNLKAESARMTVALDGGRLQILINEMSLYQGRGAGEIVLDARTPATAALALSVTLEGIETRGLLRAISELDRLSGRGRLVLDLKGKGGDEHALIGSLDGTADLRITDGAIVGVNIAQMLRSLQKGRFSGLTDSETEKTDFSELAATFTVTRGIAVTEDLRLLSVPLHAAGAGSIDLGKRLIDLNLKPKLITSPANQGGQTNATGFEVPLQVQGPWDKPRYLIDTEALLKNPANVQESVRQIENAIKGKSLDDAKKSLKGLFGR